MMPPSLLVRRASAALTRLVLATQPAACRLSSSSALTWTQLSAHVSHAHRAQSMSPTDPSDTATVLYRCTHTSPPLAVFPSPHQCHRDTAGPGNATIVTTLFSTDAPLPHTASFAYQKHSKACLVHVPPSSLAIIPPLMYWPAARHPECPADLIPLASRDDLGALASALASLSPAPQALLSHLHTRPLIPGMLGGPGTFAGIVDQVFARLKTNVCMEMTKDAPRGRAQPVTVHALAAALMGRGFHDLPVRLPLGRFAHAVASVVAELSSEGRVRDVSGAKRQAHSQAPAAYQFRASHGLLGSNKPQVEELSKLDPQRVFGPGGLSMRQIMDMVKASDGREKSATNAAQADGAKKEEGKERPLSTAVDEQRHVSNGQWVWVR